MQFINFVPLAIFVVCNFSSTTTNDTCQTIEETLGICVPLENCPFLKKKSEQKPLSQDNLYYLTLSKCGEGRIHVCCDVNKTDNFPPKTSVPLESRGDTDITSCQAPDGKAGQCIRIKECPKMLDLLKVRPYTPEIQDYLTSYGCGFVGLDAKVCCTMDENNLRSNDTNLIPERLTTSSLLPNQDICGPVFNTKIVGGDATEIAEFPWMALIEYETPTGSVFSCGGTLINKRYILTAAHCLVGPDIPPTWKVKSVRLGEYDTSSAIDCFKGNAVCADEPVNVLIEEPIVHDGYVRDSTSQNHDIALLRLAEDVAFTDYIKPICLPTSIELFHNLYDGINMMVAGWGLTENKTKSNVLLKLEVPVKSKSDCLAVYGGRVNWNSGQMCAGGEKDRDSCKGDSGGPLMASYLHSETLNYYITGIVSFGPNPCGLELWPGVYTKTSHYVPWIVSKLKP